MPSKIVYLFGAGATHAELDNIGEAIGLQIGDVTNRVLLKAKGDPLFNKIKMFLGTEDNTSTNIELLISLFENNSRDIEDSIEDKISTEAIVKKIKTLMEKDIVRALTKERLVKFSLHKGLLELHNLLEGREILLGFITLNYDSVLDDAYMCIYGYRPDYCLTSKRELAPSSKEKLPLLKLHGSFDWTKIKILGKPQKISIIPMGVNKNFLRLPYNFIWGRSLELLASCDILRVIGCSLSPNDIHLIDLLFKAHILKGSAFEMQIISSNSRGEEIKNRYSFFPKVITSVQLTPRISNPYKGNMFVEWLKVYANDFLTKNQIKTTAYLKNIVS